MKSNKEPQETAEAEANTANVANITTLHVIVPHVCSGMNLLGVLRRENIGALFFLFVSRIESKQHTENKRRDRTGFCVAVPCWATGGSSWTQTVTLNMFT